MSYSLGVRATGSPSTVTVGVVIQQMPPMISVLACTSPPPSCKYRRSCERTRASSSTGLKGLVI